MCRCCVHASNSLCYSPWTCDPMSKATGHSASWLPSLDTSSWSTLSNWWSSLIENHLVRLAKGISIPVWFGQTRYFCDTPKAVCVWDHFTFTVRILWLERIAVQLHCWGLHLLIIWLKFLRISMLVLVLVLKEVPLRGLDCRCPLALMHFSKCHHSGRNRACHMNQGRKDHFNMGGEKAKKGCSEEVIFELSQVEKLF